jgi:hypothetical protein
MDMVRQCELRAPDGGRIVTWIDAEHAAEGKRLRLKLDDGTQTPVMEVVAAWASTRTAADVRERGHDWTRTRRASDI